MAENKKAICPDCKQPIAIDEELVYSYDDEGYLILTHRKILHQNWAKQVEVTQ